MDKYQINDFRVGVLTKLQSRLHDNLLNQLPMLSHLKKWLAQLSISKPPPAKPTLIMELVPQIKQSIENCYQSRWEEVVDKQREIFLSNEGELMRQQADRMAATY